MGNYMNNKRSKYKEGEKIFLNFDKSFEIKALEETDKGKSYEFIGSKEIEDRDGDTILISGIDLENLGKNMPSFFNHNPSFVIGHVTDAKKVKKELRVTIFVLKDATLPSGVKVIDALDAESLKAVSIGFMLKKWEPVDVDDPWGGWIIKECELLEVSIVSIPANPEALLIKSQIMAMDDEVIAKFFKTLDVNSKITASKDLPINETVEWDAAKSLERVKEFAQTEDKELDVQKFSSAFMYSKSNNEDLDGYILSFADVIEGKLTAVRAGLEEASKSLDVDKDISDKDRARIKSIIKGYSEKMETPLEGFEKVVVKIDDEKSLETIIKAIGDGFEKLSTQIDTMIKTEKKVVKKDPNKVRAFNFDFVNKELEKKEKERK